jgi:hypothetical protein
MRVLREDDINEYCQEGSTAKLHEEALKDHARPAFLVPLFELCRAVHFGARAGMGVKHFRDCWQDLGRWHLEQAAAMDGYLLRPLIIDDGAGISLLQEIYEHGMVVKEGAGSILGAQQVRVDRRDLPRDPPPFTACFRKLGEHWAEMLNSEEDGVRRWSLHWPDEIPGEEPCEHLSGGDVVLDTNLFVEILEALPATGRLDQRLLWQQPQVARILAGAANRFRKALLSPRENKLIVPTSVLIEAYGVIYAQRDGQYQNAWRTLAVMANVKDQWPLGEFFRFEALSIEVFGAFLWLHEKLVGEVKDRHLWPDFADAIVLAHALYNGCPVVSAEWVDKPECWAAVRAHYSFLHPDFWG